MKLPFSMYLKALLSLTLGLCVVLSLQAQTWTQVGDTPFHKHHSNGFGINGKAYVFEGTYRNDGPDNVSNEVWEYTASTDSWVRIADFPGTPRAIAIGEEWNGKYYYGFGSAGGPNGLLNDLWVFDPVDTSYTQLPSCPCEGRTHPAFIAHNDKVFMGSGSSWDGDVSDWWEYDMITQVWTQKPDIPGGNRHHPFQFAYDEYIYVGGGHRSNWLRYDPATEAWTEIDNLPQGRVAGSQFDYKGFGYLVGGDDAGHTHVPDDETFMRYKSATDEWQKLPPLPLGSRWANSSFIIDDELYFFGGLSSNFDGDSTMWKFNLGIVECLPTENLAALNLTVSSAELHWSGGANPDTDTLRWRKVGSTDWNIIPAPVSGLSIENLEVCEMYEFEILTTCDTLQSSSGIREFTTDGCCTNPAVQADDITATTLSLSWEGVVAADSYDVRWKKTADTEWQEGVAVETSINLENLAECTDYEFQIKSICTIEDIDYGESSYFLTKGCGACLDLEYCSVSDDLVGNWEYIQEVRINDYVNTTGDNSGYASFTDAEGVDLEIGDLFEIGLVPHSDFGPLNFTIWIDLDGDGSFSFNERIFEDNFVANAITENILIPSTATAGLTRMRIAYSNNIPGNSCDNGSYHYGEVEDYCVNLISTTSADDLDDNYHITAYPNPVRNTLKLDATNLQNKELQISIIDLLGVKHLTHSNFNASGAIDVSQLTAGVYYLIIADGNKINQTIKLIKLE